MPTFLTFRNAKFTPPPTLFNTRQGDMRLIQFRTTISNCSYWVVPF